MFMPHGCQQQAFFWCTGDDRRTRITTAANARACIEFEPPFGFGGCMRMARVAMPHQNRSNLGFESIQRCFVSTRTGSTAADDQQQK